MVPVLPSITPPIVAPPGIKISAAYGRIYVSGPGFRTAYRLPGAAINDRRKWIELSLTLETLRGLRKMMGVSPQMFARYCTPDVLAWAKAAGRSERMVNELHARLETGFRMDFPWTDNQGRSNMGGYRPPFDHQKVMATVACSLEGSAFLCDMGTGKTRAGIESLRYKLESGQVDVGTVFCPRGVMGTWKREIAMWSDGLRPITLIDISVKERAAALDAYQAPGPGGAKKIFLINYDVVYLLEKNLLSLAKRMKVGLLLDEAHRIRNPQAKVCKSSLHVAAAVEWRLIMTGSPILQGAHDIWAQWYVVDLGITFGANNAQFRREFFDASPYDFHLDPKPGALEEIGKRIRKRGLRYTKADCLDLPPKIYETLEVEMSPEQKRAYKEMEAVLVARLSGDTSAKDYSAFFSFEESERDDDEDEKVVTAANQLAMILRLTQITSGFAPDQNGQIHNFLPNPKLDALEEIIEENIGSQQIIVWARYRHDHDEISKRLSRFNPKIIRGGTSTDAREDIELGFQEGRYRLLIGQPAAGGVGLNLYAASLAVYYSQSYSLEQRMQSEDRCHRSGSEIHNKVTYIDLVAKGSIDSVIVDALAGKKNVAEVVVDLKRAIGMAA